MTTLQISASFILSQACKLLLAQFMPLTANELPKPADLSAWWEQVESAIQSLDDSFMGILYDANQFTFRHCLLFGPVVLGARGW